ncbi:MAG: hypothetical protein E6J51_01515 [Chloroflexi bacterium]|nr:MAG: hypothetical protein E6J51_01515 [Chloroflexota bacterium]
MTTSSFDRNRCTRISPSAVLDDRLDGKDLEWARDHLRRCEACRERVEDFREMLLRVGRLPSAAVGSAAMDEAFALSVPDRMRAEAGSRSYDIAPATPVPTVPAPTELPPAMRPEVSSLPDLLTELEREIFRDEPVQDHPTRLSPMPEPLYPTTVEPEEIESMRPAEPVQPIPFYEPPLTEPDPMEAQPEPVETEPSRWDAAPALTNEGTVDEEPSLPFNQDAEVATPVTPQKPDSAMRIAVGLGAAACVLLAAVLYEGGWLSRVVTGRATAARVTATAGVRPSATVRASVSPGQSLSPTAAPSAPVLFTFGNGVSGGTVFRIRPGTAVAGYTRLVFDIRGGGLPTMVVTKPDDLHIAVTFQNTTAAGVPVSGIQSYQVAGIEPAVQQGADGVITIDLTRPVRVTAFTLPATGSYAWRLVVDLHTN